MRVFILMLGCVQTWADERVASLEQMKKKSAQNGFFKNIDEVCMVCIIER